MAESTGSGSLKHRKQVRTKQAGLREKNATTVECSKFKKDDNFRANSLDATNIVGFSLTLSLVFGGCCTNVWAFEKLLNFSSRVGSALTFTQMLFITVVNLPSFVEWDRLSLKTMVPRLKSRQVPLSQWAAQVVVLTFGSLLNNWAFAYDVPLPLQIIFRSSGLPVSMVLGHTILGKSYTSWQIASVLSVTFGVVLATLSRPNLSIKTNQASDTYYVGILLLTISLLLTGILGVLQERTYKKFGPCWKEGVFYTHLLSLPMFIFLTSDIQYGLRMLLSSPRGPFSIPVALNFLTVNLLTQLLCVSGVNQLTSKVSSVSTNLVLTTRKAVSLCLSVVLLGNSWNIGLAVGAGLVFIGSLSYTIGTAMW